MEKVRATPAWLYQRYRSFFDRVVPAAAMAWLFVIVNQATGAFPSEWLWFIAGGIVVAGLAAPIVGYVLFILALAYPLYTISIYVAALALSVLILLAFFVARHLAALVLILAIPLLLPYRLIWLVPFLAGLWWFEWGGVLVGMGSALWLKIFAGMCGATPDFIPLSGQTLATGQLIERFSDANSFQTLLWMTESLRPDSQTLLFHVVEVLGWGLAGYGVGMMRRRMESMSRPNLGLLVGVTAGFLGMGVGSLALPVALDLGKMSIWPISLLLNFLIECGVSGVIAVGLYGLSRHLIRPVMLPVRSRIRSQEEAPYPSIQPEPEPRPRIRPQPRVRASEDEPTDIIMIDLD